MAEFDIPKLIFHPERVAQWMREGDCFPVYVEIGPTNRCNHKCLFCALDWLDKGGSDIDSEVLASNLEDMAQHGLRSVMFAGEGEPLLHKDISRFVQTAKSNSIDVSITTNGSPLTPEKADSIVPHLSWMRFSLDAATPQTYALVHGVKEAEFERVKKNIGYATALKEKHGYPVTIGVQVLLTAKNLHEALPAAELAKSLGADNVQIKPYSHHPLSNNDLAIDFNRLQGLRENLAKLEDGKFRVFYRERAIERLQKGKDYNECFAAPFFALIDSKGNVIPCNLFYNSPEFYYGNLNQEKFSDIWAGQKRKEVLKKLKAMGVSSCREGCRLDCNNGYLGRLVKPEPHDNFI